MVVIVLLGILSAMILPQMKGTYGDALLRSTSRELVNVISLAYSRAVSQNEAHRLRLDQHTGRYFIERRIGEGPKGDEFRPVKDVSGCEGQLDKRIEVQVHPSAGEPAGEGRPDTAANNSNESPPTDLAEGITFYPDGTADGAEILLRDKEGFRLGLKLDPVTARVRIIELARE
jgi:Tfp pilus assembly protein FimT